ncbi:MAG: hypothetical protein MH252_20260 [Thermosynechococcaceae cyanobacterium MS004]|nr:hypothetical protein [Thermosynechococcaceae cyanobacterium MS004]
MNQDEARLQETPLQETPSKLKTFIQACEQIQPEHPNDIRRFFEGVVGFPYDKELLLQAFVFLNIERYLPDCDRLLLFEKSPDLGNRTDLGKCDFVYLTHRQTLCLIETKYIDLDAHGTTAQRRRTKKRKEVLAQVEKLRQFLSAHWQIPVAHFEGIVFTTDPSLAAREAAQGITTEFVSIDALFAWQASQRQTLTPRPPTRNAHP